MLESHLRDKHRSTLAEYARGNAERILRQMESTDNGADAASKPDAVKSARGSSKKPEAEWFDQCMYECKECGHQGRLFSFCREFLVTEVIFHI